MKNTNLLKNKTTGGERKEYKKIMFERFYVCKNAMNFS